MKQPKITVILRYWCATQGTEFDLPLLFYTDCQCEASQLPAGVI